MAGLAETITNSVKLKLKLRLSLAKKKEPINVLEAELKAEDPAKAALFVRYTKNSEFAGQVREMINKLKVWTGIGIKVVKRAGDKLQDLLHKSNPWNDRM